MHPGSLAPESTLSLSHHAAAREKAHARGDEDKVHSARDRP